MDSPSMIINHELVSGRVISLQARPGTDIFASPPSTYTFNAPIVATRVKTSSFARAEATVTFDWSCQFDQAGIFIAKLNPELDKPCAEAPGDAESHPRWIKAGVEAFEEQALSSVVVRDPWCDWSVRPYVGPVESKHVRVTIEVERSGHALWIYERTDQKRVLMRKVNGWFGDGNKPFEGFMLVGVYGARPDPGGQAAGQSLEIGLENIQIEAEM